MAKKAKGRQVVPKVTELRERKAHARFLRVVRKPAGVFREAYGLDEDWKEGRVCWACTFAHPGHARDYRWTFKDAPSRCPGCQGQLEDFWPIDRVIDMMGDVLGEPDAVCYLAHYYGRVVGLTWAYALLVESEASLTRHGDRLDHRLNKDERGLQLHDAIRLQVRDPDCRAEKLEEMRFLPRSSMTISMLLRKLKLASTTVTLPSKMAVVFAAEMCVEPDEDEWGNERENSSRRKGVASTMFLERIKSFIEKGYHGLIMRTRPGAGTYEWWHVTLGIPIIARYGDGRVILGAPIEVWVDRLQEQIRKKKEEAKRKAEEDGEA